jgi:hypothetical protein
MVTNHISNIVDHDCTSCNANDFSVQPSTKYGSNPYYYEVSFSDGPTRIETDFKQMKAMGFNTIRLWGFAYWERDHHHPPCSNPNKAGLEAGAPAGWFCCYNWADPLDVNSGPPHYNPYFEFRGHYLNPSLDFANDFVVNNIVLPQLQKVLDIANTTGMKVIVLTTDNCIGGSASCETGQCDMESCITPTFPNAPQEQALECKNYLEVVTNTLKNRTEILAYDLMNEPNFKSWKLFTYDKSKICEFTSLWYSAMKAKDPNHLITMGLGNHAIVQNFDPTVMKLDFLSLHIYPEWYTALFENYNKQAAIDRMTADCYFFGHAVTLPWIIGETGAQAWSDQGDDQLSQDSDPNLQTYSSNLPVGTNLSQLPYSWGSFSDQSDYIHQSQELVLNTGGSGYSWWLFQEHKWDSWDEPPPYNPSNTGIIRTAENPILVGTTEEYASSSEVPAVAVSLRSHTLTRATTAGNRPANYYKPFGGSSTTNYTVTGTVVDQNGNPIPDAIIEATSWARDASNTMIEDEFKNHFEIFTFSNADGSFELSAPIPHFLTNTNPPIDYTQFLNMRLYALGSNIVDLDTFVFPKLPDVNGSHVFQLSLAKTTLLRKTTTYKEETINYPIVTGAISPFNAAKKFKLTLNGGGVNNDGVADFHASTEVVVQNEFYAMQGSETYIHCSPNEEDCSDFVLPSRKVIANKKEEETAQTNTTGNIIVQYLLPETKALRLLPNPAAASFYIESTDHEMAAISIMDSKGTLVYTANYPLGERETIDISSFSADTYLVQLTSPNYHQTFKLIKLEP